MSRDANSQTTWVDLGEIPMYGLFYVLRGNKIPQEVKDEDGVSAFNLDVVDKGALQKAAWTVGLHFAAHRQELEELREYRLYKLKNGLPDDDELVCKFHPYNVKVVTAQIPHGAVIADDRDSRIFFAPDSVALTQWFTPVVVKHFNRNRADMDIEKYRICNMHDICVCSIGFKKPAE